MFKKFFSKRERTSVKNVNAIGKQREKAFVLSGRFSSLIKTIAENKKHSVEGMILLPYLHMGGNYFILHLLFPQLFKRTPECDPSKLYQIIRYRLKPNPLLHTSTHHNIQAENWFRVGAVFQCYEKNSDGLKNFVQ